MKQEQKTEKYMAPCFKTVVISSKGLVCASLMEMNSETQDLDELVYYTW